MKDKKQQMEKMYYHCRLIGMDKEVRKLDYQIYEKMGLADNMREVKSEEEYEYLCKVSQRPFQRPVDSASFWIEGYPLELTPIRSKEHFYQIEISLENGDFLTHPFALSNGLDENYQKLLNVTRVSPLGKEFPPEILVKKLGLLVTPVIEGDEVSYYLHDVCSVEELLQHRLKAIGKSNREVKIV